MKCKLTDGDSVERCGQVTEEAASDDHQLQRERAMHGNISQNKCSTLLTDCRVMDRADVVNAENSRNAQRAN